MVWGQGMFNNDLVYRWQGKYMPAPNIRALPNVPNGYDPYQYIMPVDSSTQAQNDNARQTYLERIGIPVANGSNQNTPRFNDYLARAEQIMFQANKVNQQAELLRLRRATQQFMTPRGSKRTPVTFKPGNVGGNLGAFLNAIAGQESGGNYGAVNRSSGALGKYQIMPGNIASWSKAALGHSITPQQFLNSPRLQEAVARNRLGQYFRQYGAAGAASAWYSGSPTKWKTSYGGQQYGYPSIHNYVMEILRRMGRK